MGNRIIIGSAMKKFSTPLVGLTLAAFVLRIYHLGSPPLLWDEGWSIGLSRLPLSEIARITALDVHPPLYYVLLKGWLVLSSVLSVSKGPHEFVTRFLSVMAGVLTVPLGFHAGRLWRDRWVGLLTALYITIAPPLVYYSQITRMFALCVMLLVLGTYGLLRILGSACDAVGRARLPKSVRLRKSEWIPHLSFIFGAVGALYSFYYAGFVLAALFIYALLAATRLWRKTLAGFGIVTVFYLPWVLYSAPAMLNRVGERTGFAFNVGRAGELALGGFYGLVFPYGIGWPAVFAILLVLVVGAIVGARHLGRWALLPALAIGATLFGAAIGAQAHMFAARYTIVASPFLALAVAGALGLLVGEDKSRKGKRKKGEKEKRIPVSFSPFFLFSFSLFHGIRRHWLFTVGLILVLVTTVPTITNYVYTKSYEVFAPFDPSADWRVLHDVADGEDIVFFNVLSLAGTYERYQTAGDPAWSYALRWDPVIEPLQVATARIDAAAASHDRLWFVLYKGMVAANADLKSWLDRRFYPAAAPGWRGDTLYLAYVDPEGSWQDVVLDAHFGNAVLERARYSRLSSVTPCAACGVVGLDLVWYAGGPVERDAKVFVHLYDEAGNLVAQHDSVPVNGSRPLTTWQVGETLIDRHGLAVPEGMAGPLQLVVGLYDPTTGERILTSDGHDTVAIGIVGR